MGQAVGKRYKAMLVDAGWLRKTVNCRAACPVHTNAQGYIEAIASGDFDAAYDIASQPNPFVNICARICGHPCETACRRGCHDAPLSIRALKRAAMDFASGGRRTGGDFRRHPKQNKRVAVIGAGPSGVTAAHDLTLLGYEVTLFEATEKLGGMLFLGIPEYRLPRAALLEEIENLLKGVEIRTNTRVGEQINFADLLHDYQAVFLAVGAQKGRQLRIDGVDADGVINGIDFLLNVNLGYKVEIGKKVVVIGGGNVAVDVARTAAREAGIDFAGDKSYGAALDVARAARRMGAPEVHMVCLESEEEMPAHEEEIAETVREGIVIHNSRGPTRILSANGKCIGLETVRCSSVFDQAGRFAPTFDHGTEELFECDTVLLAVGQLPDLSFLGDDVKLDMTPAGFVNASPKTMATNVPGVYVGGDVVFGARTAIEAIADGRRAAMAIYHYLSGQAPSDEETERPRLIRLPMHQMPEKYDRVARHLVPTISLDRRTGVSEVETGYTREQAVAEAARCLQCNRSPMLDSAKCVLCGGCVDICPFGCLKIVSIDRIDADSKVAEFAQAKHGLSIDEMSNESKETGGSWSVMLKDEEKCTRCGLCIERCPVDAMWMGRFEEAQRAV